MFYEPTNSWEISFVIAIMRPKANLGISRSEIDQHISLDRKEGLSVWASNNFTQKWFKNSYKI